MKEYKISETEAEKVLVKNANNKPNALATYGEAKKTANETKDLFDRQFILVKKKHNLLGDAMEQGFADVSEQMADDKQELKQDIGKAQTEASAAKQASSAAENTANAAKNESANAVNVANAAKSESASASKLANASKGESANAVAVANNANNTVKNLENRMNSGEFKGEKGDPFTVSKVYTSVAEMEADFANEDVAEGAFVAIETGNVDDEENARLYIKGADKFSFVTDLSGAQGIQGPQGIKGDPGSLGIHIGEDEPAEGQPIWIDTDEEEASFDVVAKAGQVLAVKSVDADGKPKEFMAVDLPKAKTADFAANEGEDGYIKNRTHYVDENGIVHKLPNKFIDADWMATKHENGGTPIFYADLVFAENNSTAYLSEYGGGFKVDAGFEFDVYWGGVKYVCPLKYHDDEPYIGNGSLGLSGAEDTGEPFCLFGMFLAPDTIAYVKKNTSTAENISLYVTVKLETKYNKLPKEYLPEGVVMSVNGKSPDASGNVEVEGGGLEPLIGTTEEITPRQVAEAVAAGRPVAISQFDEAFGSVLFNYFLLVPASNRLISTMVVDLGDPLICVAFTIVGDLATNSWETGAVNIAKKEDVSSGSIDVTASVGQTIVVEEVDANGKPTKWKSADYQPRTHWSETVIGDLVPHTEFTPALNEAFQMLVYGLPTFDFAEGKTYTVVFDGVEYTGTAAAGVYSGMPFVSVGNTVLHGVQSAEPFTVVQIPAMNMFAVVCFTADAHTIQIIGEKTVHHKIPDEYVRGDNFKIVISPSVTSDGYIANKTFEEIVEAVKAGKNVFAEITDIFDNGDVETCRYNFTALCINDNDADRNVVVFWGLTNSGLKYATIDEHGKIFFNQYS